MDLSVSWVDGASGGGSSSAPDLTFIESILFRVSEFDGCCQTICRICCVHPSGDSRITRRDLIITPRKFVFEVDSLRD